MYKSLSYRVHLGYFGGLCTSKQETDTKRHLSPTLCRVLILEVVHQVKLADLHTDTRPTFIITLPLLSSSLPVIQTAL